MRATVTRVLGPDVRIDDPFTGKKADYGSYVQVMQDDGETHTFINGSINQVPVQHRIVGKRGEIEWVRTSTSNLPYFRADHEFFHPDDCPFEILGFYEEFIDLDTEKRTSLGTRRIEKPDRPMGSCGWKEQVLTETLHLVKGLKPNVVKASPTRPRKVASMIQIICGREKNSKI